MVAPIRDFISSIAAGAQRLQNIAVKLTDTELAEVVDHDEMVKLDESVWSAIRYACKCWNSDND